LKKLKDYTSANNLITLIKNRKLARRYSQLLLVKADSVMPFSKRHHMGWRAFMSVADLGQKITRKVRLFPTNPIALSNT